jgi:hypothetical protein
MNKNNLKTISISLFAVLLLASFKGDKDKLHKRHFTISLTDGKKPKPTPDEIFFKDGKVYCGDFAAEKLGSSDQIKYELKKDSTYMDEDVEVEYIDIFATTQLEKNEIFEFHCLLENFEVQGTMKVLKSDKVKKAFEFTGQEKVKEKKK